jgi:ParB family chromosome partitioning protein
MATKKLKGLGRGLEALLGGDGDITTPDANTPSELPVTQMQAGKYQPRTRMDEGGLQELAASIKTQGIMQPILVRPVGTDKASGATKYEIIAGERRFRAAQLAGLEVLPVLVRDVDDQAAAAMALIENMQREDLNPLEEAQGIHRLITDFSFTHEQAANAVGRSRSAVSNLLRLMNLANPVQTMLMAGDVDMGHARALCWRSAASQINRQYGHQKVVGARNRKAGRTLEEQKRGASERKVRPSSAWKKSCPIRWRRRWCSRWAPKDVAR